MDAPGTEPNNNGHARRYVQYAIVAFAIILGVLFVFLVREYLILRRAQLITDRESSITAALQHKGPLTAADASVIRPWMTFDYVNRLFGLPPDYLKTQLMITNTRYPQLSIGGYANSQHVSQTIFVGQVVSAVQNYLTVQAQ